METQLVGHSSFQHSTSVWGNLYLFFLIVGNKCKCQLKRVWDPLNKCIKKVALSPKYWQMLFFGSKRLSCSRPRSRTGYTETPTISAAQVFPRLHVSATAAPTGGFVRGETKPGWGCIPSHLRLIENLVCIFSKLHAGVPGGLCWYWASGLYCMCACLCLFIYFLKAGLRLHRYENLNSGTLELMTKKNPQLSKFEK